MLSDDGLVWAKLWLDKVFFLCCLREKICAVNEFCGIFN